MMTEQKRALVAVVLSGIVLFSWQFFFANKPKPLPLVAEKQSAILNDKTVSKPAENAETIATAQTTLMPIAEKISLKNGDFSFDFGNELSPLFSAGPDAVFSFSDIVGEKYSYRIYGKGNDGKSYLFNVTKVSDNKFNLTSAAGTGTLTLNDHGVADLKVDFIKPQRLYVEIQSEAKTLANHNRSFIYFGNDVQFLKVGDKKDYEGKVKWFGLDYNYHIFSTILKAPLLSRIDSEENGKFVINFLDDIKSFEASFVFTKKNYDTLLGIGNGLELSVDFGIFGIVAVPILRGLQFFYKFVPNYGLAIILLTLVIRLITFPLQYKSFVSMKKMQKIQPELAKIKAKFKEDPSRIQKETMALFKKAGANPLGGCLPMVAQMPIFFAFYKVLYASVELVGSPFFGWIHDLSTKDPYFILPVLMALIMLVQQKITPSTATDPNQQKIMMIMPVVFGFIMKDLPSGLVLYICVSSVFGMIQQLIVYRVTD